jgi:carbon-monoxide dehydrogenase medium subunit
VVLSIGRVPELSVIELAGPELRLGAAVTQRTVQRSALAPPVLREALDHVGHVPTRNRGTVGGSVAFADPTAELPAVLLALGGSVRLRHRAAERVVPAAELFTGPFRTAMRPDELLIDVLVPVPARNDRWAFEQRHFRRHAKVCAVAGAAEDRSTVSLALAGVTDTPVLVPDAVALLHRVAEVGIDRARADVADAVVGLVTPNADPYGSTAYRRRLAVEATSAALRRLLHAARGWAAA